MASLILIAVAGVALWKPVIEPLVSDIIPERVGVETDFLVPAETPRLIFVIPQDWVVQRAVFEPTHAVIRTPDLALEILVEPWEEATAPSIQGALATASTLLQTDAEPRSETLNETLSVTYVAGTEPDVEGEVLIAVLGAETDPGVSPKALATLTVRTHEKPLEDYLPTLAMLLNNLRIVK